MACVFLNNFCCMYLIWHRPYIERAKNYNEIINEITIVITTEAMLLYTEICSPEQQEMVGWDIVLLVLGCLLLNLIYVFYQTFFIVRMNCTKYYRLYKYN